MLFFRQIVAPCSNSNAAPLFVCFSVGLSFCGTDIFLIFSNGCNGCLNAAGDVVTSACLADAEHCVRFFFCNGSGYGCDGFAEDGRNLKLYHLYVSDFFRDQLYGFQSRIDFVSAKGIKCG